MKFKRAAWSVEWEGPPLDQMQAHRAFSFLSLVSFLNAVLFYSNDFVSECDGVFPLYSNASFVLYEYECAVLLSFLQEKKGSTSAKEMVCN